MADNHDSPKPSRCQVLLYVPNLVGYLRLLLLASALATGTGSAAVTYCLFLANITLDGLDGFLARALNQTSAFGAFLDVAIDNLTRGTLYTWSLPQPWGVFPIILEATAFICTYKGGDTAWKSGGHFVNSPWWVQKVMAKGFKTLPGAAAIVGLMGLPLWLFANRYCSNSIFASPALGLCMLVGRLLCASVEVWVIFAHLNSLLIE